MRQKLPSCGCVRISPPPLWIWLKLLFVIITTFIFSCSSFAYTWYENTFTVDNVEYGQIDSETCAVIGKSSDLLEVVIPENVYGYYGLFKVVEVADEAFYASEYDYWKTSPTSVTLPHTIKRIGDRAFYGCKDLVSVKIVNNRDSWNADPYYYLEEIGEYAFAECSALTQDLQFEKTSEDTITYMVRKIGSHAYENCTALTFACLDYSNRMEGEYGEIEYTITDVGTHIFYGCTALTGASLLGAFDEFPAYTFYGCSALKEARTVAYKAEYERIGAYAFSHSGILSHSFTTKLKEIGDYAFEYTSLGYSYYSRYTIDLPESLEKIGKGAFRYCSGIYHIALPGKITEIPDSAFYYSGLQEVKIPVNVKRIGEYAFAQSSGLTNIVIPDSVEEIGNYAFWPLFFYSWDQRDVYLKCYALNPPQSHSSSFGSSYILTVPTESLDLYASAPGWDRMTNRTGMDVTVLSDEEWTILSEVNDELVNCGWESEWHKFSGVCAPDYYPHIELSNGHISSIDLSGSSDYNYSKITGEFPTSVLKLPYIESIDLSYNALNGNPAELIKTFREDNPTAGLNVKELWMNSNRLSGDLSEIPPLFPQLTTLHLAGNCFSEVSSPLPETITSVSISNQTIDREVVFDITGVPGSNRVDNWPTILLYNPQTHSFVTNIDGTFYYGGAGYGSLRGKLEYNDEMLILKKIQSNMCRYVGENGGKIECTVEKDENNPCKGSLTLIFRFNPGDSNFDTAVDILDLQTIVLDILQQLPEDKPYNRSAANVYPTEEDRRNDPKVNVQDIVVLVNMLLEEESPSPQSILRVNGSVDAQGSVYCKHGKLFITSDVPVAAFDITVDNCDFENISETLDEIGFAYSVRETEAGFRIIGYNLENKALPSGDVEIATVSTESAMVGAVLLSDFTANPVLCRLNAVESGIGQTRCGDGPEITSDGKSIFISSENECEWVIYSVDGHEIAAGTSVGQQIIKTLTQGTVIVMAKSDGGITTRKIIVNQ